MDPDGNMAWLEGLARKGIVPGLESTLELLRRVGDRTARVPCAR